MRSDNTAKSENLVVLRWQKRAASGRNAGFDERLVSITEKILKEVFGEHAASTICKYLEETYHLKLEEIPNKLDVFARALETYPDSGATVVEKRILKSLCFNSGVKLTRTRRKAFRDCLNALKRVHRD